jgi:uncharacterized protein
MFVDSQGMFVAQRGGRGLGVEIPTACLIQTALTDGVLTLSAPEMPLLRLPQHGLEGAEVAVRVWDSFTTGVDQGSVAEAWATEFLSRERPGRYRLVRMADDDRHRPAKFGEAELAFGDAYPFLILSEESLADLNRRLPAPLPMDRFRPNIVLRGIDPYGEDQFDWIRIGDVEFIGMTLCVRCPLTTTNQLTAERGKEPLTTLATYRRHGGGVVFGRNFNHRGSGWISVGDSVTSEP